MNSPRKILLSRHRLQSWNSESFERLKSRIFDSIISTLDSLNSSRRSKYRNQTPNLIENLEFAIVIGKLALKMIAGKRLFYGSPERQTYLWSVPQRGASANNKFEQIRKFIRGVLVPGLFPAFLTSRRGQFALVCVARSNGGGRAFDRKKYFARGPRAKYIKNGSKAR